jgi:hypothetical protein
MDNQKMTEAEFAKAVGCSALTVARLRKARKIQFHSYGLGGRRIYYLPEDIESWHERNRHEPIWSKNHDLRRAG